MTETTKGRAWVGRSDSEPIRDIQAIPFDRPRRVGERSIEFDREADALAYLNDVIAKSDPEGVKRGDYYVDVEELCANCGRPLSEPDAPGDPCYECGAGVREGDEPEIEDLPLYSVGIEVFVRAEHEHAAMTLVGEHFGSNLPDEIQDYIVQDATEQSA